MVTKKDSSLLKKTQTPRSSERLWIKKKLFWIACIISAVFAVYLAWDYRGPLEIPLQSDNACGIPCLRAKDLLVQGHDIDGHLWATRGMVAYRLQEGESKFARQYHIPTGFSIFWLRNFSIVRRVTLRPECVELLPISEGEACAMSAGRMWYRPANGEDFEETLTLPHYGIFTGQGVRNDGLARLSDGTILFGEYFTNRDRTNVRIYSSEDNGRTWQVAYDFRPGQIRHVHAVQQDPYTGKVWICTGDHDHESTVAWSSDGCKTLNPIGQGSQIWRVCQLVFTKDALFWGTDTGRAAVSGIYRWDRTTHELTKLIDVPGEMFYATRLADGTIVMSTVCNGSKNEKDEKTRLWIVTHGENVTSIVCGKRASTRKFAKLRFQRDQGSASLYLTCLNQEEYNDGDLIVISEKVLRAAAEDVR
ncbi:MAG: exo-alpha-sialidase [Gammaproteobacteria bacterium]|nr:exo-alpha-sialidase [Gammaproteobacteria bacterium]